MQAPPEGRPAFTTTARDTSTGPVIEIAGELDLDSAPVLHAVLHRALTTSPPPAILVVDLAGVTFCDSTGLNALLRTRTEAQRKGVAFHLARPTDIVARFPTITGTDQVFFIDQDVPATVPHTPAG